MKPREPVEPILTVTLNPAIDLELNVGELRRGDAVPAQGTVRCAGGKGINVAQSLASLRLPVAAAFVGGGPDCEVFLSLLDGAPIALHLLPIGEPLRTNVSLISPGKGTIYKVNQPGPTVTDLEVRTIEKALVALFRKKPRWVVLSGSLAPGMPPDFYARLVRAARKSGARVAIDASGTPLALAIAEGPDLVRINRQELEATLEVGPLNTLDLLRGAMAELQAQGAGIVVISDGPRASHLLVDQDFLEFAPTETFDGGFSGAGDAMMAGLVAGLDLSDDIEESFTLGVFLATEWIRQNIGLSLLAAGLTTPQADGA